MNSKVDCNEMSIAANPHFLTLVIVGAHDCNHTVTGVVWGQFLPQQSFEKLEIASETIFGPKLSLYFDEKMFAVLVLTEIDNLGCQGINFNSRLIMSHDYCYAPLAVSTF